MPIFSFISFIMLQNLAVCLLWTIPEMVVVLGTICLVRIIFIAIEIGSIYSNKELTGGVHYCKKLLDLFHNWLVYKSREQ